MEKVGKEARERDSGSLERVQHVLGMWKEAGESTQGDRGEISILELF